MNFIGVGPAELLVVLLVALIFVGPQRLPRLAADLARMIRDLRRYTGQIAAEFSEVIEDLQKETEADRTEWKEIGQGLADATSSVTSEIAAARSDVRKAANGAVEAPPGGTAEPTDSPPPVPAERP